MDNITSTIQSYQPIFVGAGCLAMGYMFGRHCRSMIENRIGVPMASDAACCCEQSEGNHVLNNVAIDQDKMRITRPTCCQIDSTLNYTNQEIVGKIEKFGKRDLGQLEIFEHHSLQRAPKKKEDVLWAQTGAYKKQKAIPIIWKELMETKPELEQDGDDEILARRLEYFTKSASGTRASINKSRKNNFLKLSKKKKTTVDVTTSCKASRGKETIIDSQKSLSKGTTKSFTGLNVAFLTTCVHDQSECSLEDTCRLPKIMCLDCVGEKDVGGCQVKLTNFAQQIQIVDAPCECSKNTFSNILLEEHIRDDMLLEKDLNFKGLTDSQNDLNKCDNNSNHTMNLGNEEDDKLDATMEDVASKEDIVLQQSLEKQLELSISPPSELHVQNMCLIKKQEVKEEHAIPMDKVLKVEIYELLHAANCAKISFEQIVSLLEEKLKVVLREDKAHIVSLIWEVINISKLLEEERVLEGLE